jgi:hypothetical protein
MQIFRKVFFADYKEFIYCFVARLHMNFRFPPKVIFKSGYYRRKTGFYFLKIQIELFSIPNIPVADAVAAGAEQEWSWRVCRLLYSGGKAVAALLRRRSGGVAAAPTEGRRRRRRRRCGGSGRSGWRACSSSYVAPPGPWR